MPDDLQGLRLDIAVDHPGFSLVVDECMSLDSVTALFGPSGAGKSTLLRVIAGLDRNARGLLRFGESIWQETETRTFVPAYRRSVGMVFQDPYLFPHLNVTANLQYAFRRRRNRSGPDFDSITDALDLAPLLPRQVPNLSGGERQRVALGRTLLSAPSLLLLDEPLAAIDADAKAEIMPYLQRIITEFAVPVIYVSHSAEEIRQLAGSVYLIRDGRIRNHGDIDLLQGMENRAYLRIAGWRRVGQGRVECQVGDISLEFPATVDPRPDSRVMLSIDTSRILVMQDLPDRIPSSCSLPVTIRNVSPASGGGQVLLDLESAGGRFPVTVHANHRYGVGQRTDALLLRHPVLVTVPGR